MKFQKILIFSLIFLGVSACTDLEEKLNSTLTEEQAIELGDPGAILKATYNGMRNP